MKSFRTRAIHLAALALAAAAAAGPSPARATGEVVVIRSTDLPAYRAVEQSFLASVGTAGRALQLAPGNLAEQVRITTSGAKVLFAIGPDVAVAAASLGAPLLYAMVPSASGAGLDPALPGVPMYVSPGHQVRAVHTVLPRAQRVGILYDPAVSSGQVAECESALLGAGLRLVRKEVGSRAEVPGALRQLLPTIDVLWLVPDSTVIGAETLRVLLQTPLAAKVPVVGYTEIMARAGALLTVEARWDDVGRKAAAAAKKMLAGGKPSVSAPDGALFLNARTASALGIELSAPLRAEAAHVFE